MNRVFDESTVRLYRTVVHVHGEFYVFTFTEENKSEVLRTLGRFASNPELSFTWNDAAVVSGVIRRMKGAKKNENP